MSMTTVPAPLHVSQRPPSVLNENIPAVIPWSFAVCVDARAFRISSHALTYVAGFDRVERPIGDWSMNWMSSI